MKVEIKPFGAANGVDYHEIFITNDQGTQISFSDLGARINRWADLDEKGQWQQFILGYNQAADVFTSTGYYGATIGRTAGRIEDGKFTINGTSYQLEVNNGNNHLHGGLNALDKAKFDYQIQEEDNQVSIIFSYQDAAGKNCYPGTLDVTVIHRYNNQNEWTIEYLATSDQATLFNPTNHVYFNLNSNNEAPIYNHQLKVESDTYLPLKENMIAKGQVASVEQTIFDLRQWTPLKDVLRSTQEPQFTFTKGYDHPFILNKGQQVEAALKCDTSGRMIEVETDEKVVVIYCHGYLSDTPTVWGNPIVQHSGITFETQNIPNAINWPLFGDTVLNPSEQYHSRTCYRYIKY